jgi:DNA-directed RNA polymerase subunit RPC12/RpoP
MINAENFRKPDGWVDYPKYNAAYQEDRANRIAKGDLCSGCGSPVMYGCGHPQKCRGCMSLDIPDRLFHDQKIRCPDCGYHWRVSDSSNFELLKEGSHDVTCPDCGGHFEIHTYVTHSFLSPERKKTFPE